MATLARTWRLRDPSEAEYHRFVTYVHDASGISLNDSKRALVARRLSARLRELGIESLDDYLAYLNADESGAETVRLLDLIATNETHFFRERPHWEFLETRVFPKWLAEANAGKRSKVVRAWSAACSTGQEPYSLAMQMLTFLPPDQGWQHEIVATDISTHVLDVARRAEWPIEKAPEIPEHYLERYMLRGVGNRIGRMRASAVVRDLVTFERLNLSEERYAVKGSFDLIFCRNVLIYFDAPGRAATLIEPSDRAALPRPRPRSCRSRRCT